MRGANLNLAKGGGEASRVIVVVEKTKDKKGEF